MEQICVVTDWERFNAERSKPRDSKEITQAVEKALQMAIDQEKAQEAARMDLQPIVIESGVSSNPNKRHRRSNE